MLNMVTVKKLVLTVSLLLTAALLSAQEFIGNTEKPYVRTMTISSSNINNLPETIESNCFYKLDLFIGSDEYSVCRIDIWNEKDAIDSMITVGADEENHFVKKIYIPLNSTKVVFNMFRKDGSKSEVFKVFSLRNRSYDETPVLSYDEKTGITKITIDYTNLASLPQTVKRGGLYEFDVFLDEADFNVCYFQNIYDDAKLTHMDSFAKQPDGHFVSTFIVPSTLKTLIINLGNENLQNSFTALSCSAEGSTKPAVLNTVARYLSAQNYRHRNADETICNYLREIDARKISRENPDEAIEIILQKICEWTDNDFEKIMFIHDAVWYLLDYDLSVFEKGRVSYQDYFSALKDGVTTNEGFVNTFSQMCYKAGIPCVKVYGEALFPREFNIQTGNHAWNIVKIDGYWYTTDITWDCSHVSNGIRDDFYTSMWMFVSPKMFIKTHYPEFREYQLLEKPYVRKELIK